MHIVNSFASLQREQSQNYWTKITFKFNVVICGIALPESEKSSFSFDT